VQPDDAERHRQAAPPLDHPDQVGVGGVVVGFGVAGVAVAAGQQAGQRRDLPDQILDADIERRRVARDGREMLARRLPVGLGRIDPSQLQGGVGQLELAIGQLADGVERRVRVRRQLRPPFRASRATNLPP